jgi:hypothetical protein
MAWKWKPSQAQRREFAQKMQNDEAYRNAYFSRKEARSEKRRSTSRYDYGSAGGYYVPTKTQNDFCMENIHLFAPGEEMSAANNVMYGYSCNEKIHHDYIHAVNEKIRKYSL